MAFAQDDWPLLLVQNPDGSGGRVALGVNCVLGKSVELALRLEFRPAVGSLPIPLACQRAGDLRTLELADVLRVGEVGPARVVIQVPPPIATKAIQIACEVMAKFRGPLQCSVCAVDHTGSSSSCCAHDAIMLAAGSSLLGEGLQSTEIRLREIKAHPSRYDWFGTLTREAEHLLLAELGTEIGQRLLKGRVLVLVQLAGGDTVFGPHRIHIAHCESAQFPVPDGQRASWRAIEGWEGFTVQSSKRRREQAPGAQDAAAAQPVAAPPKAARPPMPELSAEVKWDMLLARLPAQGAWIPLPEFLNQVRVSCLHPKRYLEPTGEESNQVWHVGPNNRPATYDVDYTRMGRGGKYHAGGAFLKQVFFKYYERNWRP